MKVEIGRVINNVVERVWQLVFDDGVGNGGVSGWYYVDGHRDDAVGTGMGGKSVGLGRSEK